MKNVIVFLLLSLNFLVYSQEKTRILFILDASNSMNLKWDEQTRMESAKEILNQSVQDLKGVPNLEIALRVYGINQMCLMPIKTVMTRNLRFLLGQ